MSKAKLKTRKAVSKRFKVTGTGKLVHESIGLNHLMRKKTHSRRRRLINGNVLSSHQVKRVARMMGEGH
jgi:large subunit ribosomal protein L35